MNSRILAITCESCKIPESQHQYIHSSSFTASINIVIIETMKMKLMRLWSTIFRLSLKICHFGVNDEMGKMKSSIAKNSIAFHSCGHNFVSFYFILQPISQLYNFAQCRRWWWRRRGTRRIYPTSDTECYTCTTLIHAVLSSKYYSRCAMLCMLHNKYNYELA